MQTERIGAIAVVLLFTACSTTDNQQPPATQPGTDAAADVVSDLSTSDQVSEPPVEAAAETAADAKEEPCVPVDYTPTPDQVNFKALNPMPQGEQLVVGFWASSGVDNVKTMNPDGTGAKKLFEVHRIWSMGVSRAVDKIAFASGDPEQEKHFCLTIGDAIQHTWMYDVATQQATLIAGGNVNDECHTFGPGDKNLYICRRQDFKKVGDDFINRSYRVGRINLQDNTFAQLTDESGYDMSLHGVPSEDESQLYYTLVEVPENTRTLMRKPMTSAPDAGADIFLDEAGAMAISPDGKKFVYANSADKSALYIADIATPNAPTKLTSANGNDVAFSPDGTKIAYLIWDDTKLCSHIDVVKTDGSQVDDPTRIHDCVSSDSPSELAWVVKP
jgi:dipeptidyl aminopeptidase/acylaminoacyl peptidase